MRIGIDARELAGKPTGVGRYLTGLLREWASLDAARAHQFLLFSHEPIAPDTARFDVRLVPGAGGTAWEQQQLARQVATDRIDVLFSPAYSTPLFTRVPRVVALHDISFVARPEWFHWREGLRRRVLAKRAANAARTVITISEFSKQEIVTRLGVPAARVRVVPPGIDVPACDDAGQRTDSAQLLYVGSIFNRRHVTELIAAFDRMAGRHPDATLHIVGDNRTYPHQDIAASIDRRPTAARIHWHRYVPEAELRRLYGGARGFVFLSEYEGLGLTPLEALSVGVPCLLLDTPVARESCGDAALYVDADVDAISASLERLLYDGPTRTALLDAAPAAVARYDWPRAARDTLAVLEEAR